MAATMTFSKNAEGTFDVKLSGGSPWGFTLQGGSEFHSKLCVSKLTPDGKADKSDAFAVGDEIVAINGIECCSRAEAIELVRCSRQKLRITLRRSGGGVPMNSIIPEQNGPPSEVSGPVPNLYKTALELNASDFYSTYNVDPEQYSKVMQSQPLKRKTMYDSAENLSASHEDLLASYRGVDDENLSNAAIGQQHRTLGSPLEIANGRMSPEAHGLSGVSLPEGHHWQYNHSRNYTSPARIQKVKITSMNISGPDHMPPGASGEMVSPSGHGIPPARSKSATPPKPGRLGHNPDWVQSWLRQGGAPPGGNVSVAAARAMFDQGGDRPVQVVREEELKPRDCEQDNHLNSPPGQGISTRSKSFAGIASYGMKVTATTVRGRRSVQEEITPVPPTRSSSSNLSRTSPHVLEPRHSSSSSLPVDMPIPEAHAANLSYDVGQLRHRDAPPRPFMGGSSSSLDQLGGTDSSTGSLSSSRRQGPAPPPRHSTSKLLSSFRTRGRRVPAHVFAPTPVAVSPTSPKPSMNLEAPRHSASKSWPTEHVVDATPADNRQSWHAEPPITGVMATTRREANMSGSSTSSEGNLERKNSKSGQRYSSSVVIRTMRSSSSSSSEDRNAPTYYSSARAALKHRESEPSRIEDTKILLRLMQDKVNAGVSVKARVSAVPPEQDLNPDNRSRSVSQVLPSERKAMARASAVKKSVNDSILTATHCPTASDVTETTSRRTLAEPGPTNQEPTSPGQGIRVSPRFRSPNGPELPRGSEVSVAVVSPTGSGLRKPKVKPEEVQVVEVVQQQENVVDVENIFQKMDQELLISPKEDPLLSQTAPSAVADINDVPPPPKVGDDDVFLEEDDPLPPPPPEADLAEFSQDNIPLPSPPEEVLPQRKNSPHEKHRIEEIQDAVKIAAGKTLDGEELNDKYENREAKEFGEVEVENAKNLAVNEHVEALETNIDFASPEPAVRSEGVSRVSPPAPLVITSTPTSDQDGNAENYASPVNSGSTLSTPSGSRPNSMLSPKLEALDKEKAGLVGSMEKKISDLRSQMQEIDEEIKANEELGEKVTKVVEKKAASTSEFSKYQLFTGELNKIIGLLLSLTQRMHRYEMMLQDLDMSEEADRLQRDVLLEKIDKVKMQYEEACKIKEVNDKRGEVVSKFLENYLDEEEFADFQYYIDMKTQLALMHAEIRDKVKMGEERLNALTNAEIDWSILSLGS